ncbi:MAG: MFS transporter [Gammaproteobacteria bacterium]
MAPSTQRVHVLMELGKTRWQPLIFSIKQTGIPLGGALAGALLPTVVSSASWQVAALAVATLALVVAALTQPLRQRLDAGREAGRTLAGISVARPLRAVFGQRTLRAATLVAFAYAGCQVSVGAFFVVYLVHDLGMDLVHAGWIFAAVQAGGICGRLLWARWRAAWLRHDSCLCAVGLLTACCLALSAALTRTLECCYCSFTASCSRCQ